MSNSALGNKEIFAKNLRRYMEEHEKTRRDLCDDLGFSYMIVSDWCNAKKYPRIDRIEKLANYFGIEKSDLIEPPAPEKKAGRGVKIPVLGTVAAGIPIEAVEDILDYEEIEPELAATGEFFALRIKGDSMEPRMQSGDVVIVRQQPDVESGDVAVVLVNGDEATVKKLLKQSGGIVLQAFNPAYEPMFFSLQDIEEKPVRVIGKVIELRSKF